MAAAAIPIDDDQADDIWSEKRPFLFMPFKHTQRFSKPLKCDGSLLLYELSAAVFTPAARGWTDLLMLPDRVRLVRMLTFLMQVACDCNATVCIETVVENQDYTVNHKEKLNDDCVVTAYRFWIPLDAAQEIAFLHSTAAAISPLRTTTELLQSDAGWLKKRRRADVFVDVNIPEFAKPLGSISELTSIVRLYYMGTRKIDIVHGAEVTSDIDDGESVSGSNTLTQLLDASLQFNDPRFLERCQYHNSYTPQRSIENYVTVEEGTHAAMFDPKLTDLIRCFTCGSTSSFIKSGTDIFRYMLPQYSPSASDIRTKLESVFAARGTVMLLKNKTIEELVEMSVSEDAPLCQDPHAFSPVTIEKEDDIKDCTDSFYESALRSQYFALSKLKARNIVRRQSALEQFDTSTIVRIFTRTFYDLSTLFSAPPIRGSPPVYNDLKSVSDTLLKSMYEDGPALPIDKDAKVFFTSAPRNVKKSYRGFSSILARLAVGTRNNLGLQDHQKSVWLLLYLRHFSVTLNKMAESFFGVLTGPPGSGKSRAVELFASCIPSKLIMQVDGASALAITTYGPQHDLRVVLVDELKSTSSDRMGGHDVATKLEQSQISNGCVSYNVKIRDPRTGKWKLESTLTILRNFTVTSTNFMHRIPQALADRATTFVVPSSQASRKRGKHVSHHASVACRELPKAERMRLSWAKCLQTYSSLQWRYTAFEAAGLIDRMDETLMVLFFSMLFAEFGDSVMKKRRVVSLKQFALSMRIFDLITTWHTRGLHKSFEGKPEVEIMWYSAGAYITAECIVAAYTLLEQTSSIQHQFKRLVGYIKETIIMANDHPMIQGEYYVSRMAKQELLIKLLKKHMTEEGEGVVEKLFDQIDSGLAKDKTPITKIEKADEIPGMPDKYMFHRTWMADYLTDTEASIVSTLKRLWLARRWCYPEYENETTHVVFEQKVLLSFHEQDTSELRHPELDAKSKSQIIQAIRFLYDARDSAGEPAFRQVNWANAAKTVKAADNAKESKLVPGEMIVPKEIFNGLIVSMELFTGKEQKTDTIELFLKKFLTVAGGYQDNRRVFAGVDPHKEQHIPDVTIRVPMNATAEVTIPNFNYNSKACATLMGEYNDDDDESDDDESQRAPRIDLDDDSFLTDSIFDPACEYCTFTEKSDVEAKVAARAFDRTGLPHSLRKSFLEARKLI